MSALEHVYHHGFLNVLGKALSLDFQSIVARYELSYFIDTIGTGSSRAFRISAQVHNLHRSAGNQATFLITNYSSDCARIGGLPEDANRQS